jgi:hypothetical protein
MSNRLTAPGSHAPDLRAKATLLCAHARELSIQCTIAFRHGGMDSLIELQDRKHVVVQELAVLLRDLDVTGFPDLHEAVEGLREALREETRIFAEGSKNLRNELMTVNAAQRRLTQAHRYDTAGQAMPVGGSQLSICG